MAMNRLKSIPRQFSVEESKIAELYQKGYSDTTIARKLGLSRAAIALWRKSQGLESNKSLNYGPELVSKCKGCLYANESKHRCDILTEPGWFWREGKSCSFRKDKVERIRNP